MSARASQLRFIRGGGAQARLPQDPPRARPSEATRSAIARRPLLGEILLSMNAVDPGNLLKAIALRDRMDAKLGEILLARGWVSPADLLAAMAHQWRTNSVDVIAEPPDPRLVDALGADRCLADGMVPWRRVGGATVIATARPDAFAAQRWALTQRFGRVSMAIAPEEDIRDAILAMRAVTLARRAEARVNEGQSCRPSARHPARPWLLPTLAGLLVLSAVAAPVAVLAALTVWALAALILVQGLKGAALVRTLRDDPRRRPEAPLAPLPPWLPVVSVMVPMFREDDIAPRLVERLQRIDYPRELLDIVLVVEETDAPTRAALSGARLPRWMRVVTVPDGPIRTKPRALNYALDFCRGSIVGVWDAEDAPEPGQVMAAVRAFHAAPERVACLQGVLDYYDARHNWLTRCFTIEYASWFRVILPGIARLGLVVPLGGTSMFVRRAALEAVGAWDAHNVTEDADLGVRLARHGYRTEMLAATTEEEPNSHPVTWVRQRSRWLKGFALTWATHMRDPRQLWRDLGARRFLSLQILLLAVVSQYVLAPVLWSYWALVIGLGHPVANVLPAGAAYALIALFVGSGLMNLVIGIQACRGPGHRHLLPFVPTMCAYFPLGTIAAYKALYEAALRPFFWDKTRHAVLPGATALAVLGDEPLSGDCSEDMLDATFEATPSPVRPARRLNLIPTTVDLVAAALPPALGPSVVELEPRLECP